MIGTTISHFRIVDLLGKGGMGEVCRADDTRLGAIWLTPQERRAPGSARQSAAPSNEDVSDRKGRLES